MKRMLCAAALAGLAACTTTTPDVVPRHEVQRLSQVWDATVLSVRPVTVDGSQSGIGAGAGAIAGGVAGSNIGGYRDGFVASIIGAVIGGVIGNAVERGVTRESAVEIVVQLRNGERRSVVQATGAEAWAPGDAVLLVVTGGRTRVSHAPVVVPTPEPAPVPRSQPVPPRS